MFAQISLTVIGAVLSVILTRMFIRNGKLIEQNSKKLDLIAELIKSEGEKTRELLMELRK